MGGEMRRIMKILTGLPYWVVVFARRRYGDSGILAGLLVTAASGLVAGIAALVLVVARIDGTAAAACGIFSGFAVWFTIISVWVVVGEHTDSGG